MAKPAINLDPEHVHGYWLMPNQELPNSTQVRGGLVTRQVLHTVVVHNGSVSTQLTLQSLIGAVLNTVHIYTSANSNIYCMFNNGVYNECV